MIKKFWKKNKGYLTVAFIIGLIFMCGFMLGRYGKSAPNIEVAEGRITESTTESVTAEAEQHVK